MKPSRDMFVQYRVINGNKYIMKDFKVFQLDEVGEMIWDSLDGKTSLDEIAEKISQYYDMDKNIIINDINIFIKNLEEQELIEV